MITLIITLTCGLILGFSWTTFSIWLSLRIFKAKCYQCKQSKPICEVVVLNWKTLKTRVVTGKLCHECSKSREKIFL